VVHAPPPLDTEGKCPEAAGTYTPLSRGVDGPTTLRITYRQHGGALVCDAVVPLEGEVTLVGVPKGTGGQALPRLDIAVEAFRGDAASGAVLVASGIAHDVDLGGDDDIHVFVAPRDRFGCTHAPSVRGRAFHSATTLPSGEVLLVGGLVPDPEDAGATEIRLDLPVATGGFYASASVEIYDPKTASFREVNVPGLTPRAFHHAYLVPGAAGEAPRVLLVGGLSPLPDALDEPVADGIRDAAEPLRLVPTAQAVPAPTEVITLTAASEGQVATLDGAAAFAPRMMSAGTRGPSPGDEPAEVPQLPPLVAGGYQLYPSTFTGTFETADLGLVSSQGDATWILNPGARVGATATWLAPDRALVWGGNLGSAAGAEVTEVGNVLSGFAGAPATALATFDAMGMQPAARAFHAAVSLGLEDVLVVGGYQVAGGSTGEPMAPFAERVRFPAGGAAAVIEVVSPAGAIPVGYLDAVPLLGDGALVTGGNPALGMLGAPCPDGTINFPLCAVNDAWRWDPLGNALVRADSMKSPRWGHASAVLLDGTVLITGGFRNEGNKLFVVRAAEVYNPRTEARDLAGDALGMEVPPRAPGDVARGADGTALSPCTVTEVPAK
jgi:hypothetical protein